jgi:hypothetical protein
MNKMLIVPMRTGGRTIEILLVIIIMPEMIKIGEVSKLKLETFLPERLFLN